MQDIGLVLVWVRTLQAFAETQFTAQGGGLQLGGQETIGATLDDKAVHALGADFSAPIRVSFEYAYTQIFRFFEQEVGRLKP